MSDSIGDGPPVSLVERFRAGRFDERCLVPALFVGIVALRLVYMVHYAVDSDEPQHLHVVWGWLQGQISYRDFFDNHTPLFHVLCVPLLRLIGERPDIIVLMRLAVFPLYLLTLLLTYRIALSIASQRVARWATVFAAINPFTFIGTLEYRTDDLWMFLWVASVAVLVLRPLIPGRLFVAGLLLGATLTVSMKTALLLITLGIAAASILLFMRAEGQRPSFRVAVGWSASALAGFLIFPAALFLFYASQHAVPQLLYCTIWHNSVPQNPLERLRMLLFPLGVWLYVRALRQARCRHGSAAAAAAEMVVVSANLVYITLLLSFWPVIEFEHFPLWVPFVSIQIAQWIFSGVAPATPKPKNIAARLKTSPKATSLAFITALAAVVASIQLPWSDNMSPYTRFLGDVLRLTGPDDWAADNKGETVFRKRSTYYVTEWMTRVRFATGFFEDNLAERIVATRTCVLVASPLEDFPPRTRAFLLRNFVPVNQLGVAGQVLWRTANAELQPVEFQVDIPAEYAIVDDAGPLEGVLDGVPFLQARYLEAGAHTFRPERPAAAAVLIWDQAIERGYSPFPLRESFSSVD